MEDHYKILFKDIGSIMEVLISCQTDTQGEDNGEDSCSKFSKKKKERKNKHSVYPIKGREFSSCTIVFMERYYTA